MFIHEVCVRSRVSKANFSTNLYKQSPVITKLKIESEGKQPAVICPV